MTKTAFNRDNILTEDERVASARKCTGMLAPHWDRFNEWERQFYNSICGSLKWGRCTERQLLKLRDMVEKYAQ